MSSLATVTATRRPKWQYPQPVPPTPRIIHFPRRPRTRRRPSKSLPAKPSSGFDGRGKLETLFDQERAFLKDGCPVVLMDRGGGRSERVEERESGGSGAAAEEKWRFQAEMLRAECNLLRMEREITNKKLEKMKVRMERTLKSAVQALVSVSIRFLSPFNLTSLFSLKISKGKLLIFAFEIGQNSVVERNYN